MKKNMILIVLFGLLAIGLNASQLEANFVQCPGGPCAPPEGTTDDADLINGTSGTDEIFAQDGDDVVFGNDGVDLLEGELGNDLMFGGLGSDDMAGGEGNDILLPGADDGMLSQRADGREANDTINVLASEITTCLFIEDLGGNDTVNLIGFGPYTAVKPFGQPGFLGGDLYVVDPITGGEIFIRVIETDDTGIEVVNGLPSPNVTILEFNSPERNACPNSPNF